MFSGHDCQSAAYAKLAGLKNGVLLAAAEAADFEILITTDQEIHTNRISTGGGFRSSFCALPPTASLT